MLKNISMGHILANVWIDWIVLLGDLIAHQIPETLWMNETFQTKT